MVTLTTSQYRELQQHFDAIHSILSSAQTADSSVMTQAAQLMPQPMSKPVRRTDKRPAPKRTQATFTYRYMEQHADRIGQLYQRLLNSQWIAQDTNPDHFIELFSGKESVVTIKWLGKKSYLAYLFKLLVERNYIYTPSNIGKWQIVCSHFTDKSGRIFTYMNRLRNPKRAKLAIGHLAELLNPSQNKIDY